AARALRSVPTPRSSDLDADQLDLRHGLKALSDLQARGTGFAINEYFGHGDAPAMTRHCVPTVNRTVGSTQRAAQILVQRTMIQSDRKSTRLNSSHVKIS